MLYFVWCVFELRARRETLARQNRLQKLQQRTAQQGLVFKGTSHERIGQLVRLLQDYIVRQHFYYKVFSLFFQTCSQKADVLNYLMLFIQLIFCRWY